MEKVRHMFPGGNTYKGFFSYYNFIMPQEKANRIFILKGGPGVGKSTFMKYIADNMLAKGYDIELMHCSSDPDSLDGVVIPEMNTALMDGTAPHIVEPRNPGTVDEIINLGTFQKENNFLKNKSKILLVNKEIGKTFARAYRYIQAAYSIYEDNSAIYSSFMDHGKANMSISEIVNMIFNKTDVVNYEGSKRHLFASAITPQGFINYLQTLMTTKSVIIINGKPGTGTERLLERVRLCATERGLYTESYYCGLNPTKLEHLIIPELDTSITTSNSYHKTDTIANERVDFDAFLDEDALYKYREIILFNQDEFDKLLNMAVKTIKQAKTYHDELESYYVPNMNFSEVEKCRQDTLARLL